MKAPTILIRLCTVIISLLITFSISYSQGNGKFELEVGVEKPRWTPKLVTGNDPDADLVQQPFFIPILFTQPDTTKVGIGTNDPQAKLDVRGPLRIGDLKNNFAWEFREGINGGVRYLKFVNVNPSASASKNLIFETDGNIGIGSGAQNPKRKLHVDGGIFAGDIFGTGLLINGTIKGRKILLKGDISAQNISLSQSMDVRNGISANSLTISGDLSALNATINNNLNVTGIFSANNLSLTGSSDMQSLIVRSCIDANCINVDGTLRLNNGTEGAGKVLVSDVDGNANWVDQSTLNDGDWLTNADGNIYRPLPGDGRVGIGTNDPQKALHIFTSHIVGATAPDPPDPTGSEGGSHEGIRLENNVQADDGSFNVTSTWDIEPFADENSSQLNFVNINGTTARNVLSLTNNGLAGIGRNTGLRGVLHINRAGSYRAINIETETGSASDIVFADENTGRNWVIRGHNGGSLGKSLTIWSPEQQGVVCFKNSNVIIGTSDPVLVTEAENSTEFALNVCGSIRAKEIKVNADWCDFVFEPDYELMSLGDLELYIKKNKHLPGIPTEAEVESNGVELGDVVSKLLQKTEELTLYVIELKKENEELRGGLNLLTKYITNEEINLNK